MYLEACLQRRRHFSPFVTLVYGLLGVEAMANLKRLASRLATKCKQYYSKTCGYVKSFTPSHVRDKPLIYSGRAMSRTKPMPAGSNNTKPTDAMDELI